MPAWPLPAATFFVALPGGTILLFYPSDEEWGFWLGLGVLLYAGAKGLYGALATIRLFRRAASPLAGGGATQPLASPNGAE